MLKLQQSSGFDPSILRHSGIRGASDEAVLNEIYKETKGRGGASYRRRRQ